MKAFTATKAAVVALALVGALALVSTAGAGSQVPLSATLSGSVSETLCVPVPLTFCLTASDQGIGTHFGLATLTKSATIHPAFMSCDGGGLLATYTETATLTAANGDTLTLSGTGTACAANGHAIGSTALTVTGGTGRFVVASGSLTESIDHNLVTDVEVVSLSGTISSPGPS